MNQVKGALQSKFNRPLRENEKVYIRWSNINYYVQDIESATSKVRKSINSSIKKMNQMNNNFDEEFNSLDIDGLQRSIDLANSNLVPNT